MSSALVAPGEAPLLDCRLLSHAAAAAQLLAHPAAAGLALTACGSSSSAPAAAAAEAAAQVAVSRKQPLDADREENVAAALSPTAVAGLQAAAAAESQLSSDPATPAPSSGASASDRHQAASVPPSPSSLTPCGSAGDGELQQELLQAVQQQAARQQRQLYLDIPALVQRLKERPLTGQVVAWGWDTAAALSGVRRTMPAQLFSSLWPATEACVFKLMPQDVLEVLESWLTLMQQCPRHFRLSKGVLEAMATYGIPCAVKRMEQAQLAQLACLARDIALHRSDAAMQFSGPGQAGSSARDLMQPIFALVAAETAWRCCNPARYVSAETVSTVITSAPAWSWRVVRHCDSPALAALKLATAAALEELKPHSPRDLSQSGAFGKLKTDPVSPRRPQQQ